MSWFKGFTEKVQSVLPKLDNESILESLTLTTPALKAERERLDASERQKETVRNMLSGMLPWQTRDPERDILVEECKDAILLLSKDKATFFGPYQMPPMDAKTGDDDDDDESEKEITEPSKESLEMLAKLEPLPSLLRDFDFQAHVGLIEKMLAEDQTLVEMQSLSGGGLRERVFWKNYFFHCAYTRYEAGLSIDEIWSDMPDEERSAPPVTSAPKKAAAPADVVRGRVDEPEETITFESIGVDAVAATDEIEPEEHSELSSTNEEDISAPVEPKPTMKSSESADFEMVGDESSGVDVEGDTVKDDILLDQSNYELDELEAEIARELEDD